MEIIVKKCREFHNFCLTEVTMKDKIEECSNIVTARVNVFKSKRRNVNIRIKGVIHG